MNAIVPGETQFLEFPVVVEPEVIGNQLTDGLSLVALHHGEESPTDGSHQ